MTSVELWTFEIIKTWNSGVPKVDFRGGGGGSRHRKDETVPQEEIVFKYYRKKKNRFGMRHFCRGRVMSIGYFVNRLHGAVLTVSAIGHSGPSPCNTPLHANRTKYYCGSPGV